MAHVPQLSFAWLFQPLPLAQLAGFDLAPALQIARCNLEQLLRLVQLLREGVGLLLAANQFALHGLVLPKRRGGDRRKDNRDEAIRHGLAGIDRHSSRSRTRSGSVKPEGSKR